MDLPDAQFNIEDMPVEPPARKRARPRFLGDDLDDHETMNHASDNDAGSLNAYFDDLEESRLPAPLDHAAIEENIAAKKKDAIDPFTVGDPEDLRKKVGKRRHMVTIDESLVLDPKIGIPKLIEMSKEFKCSGKGKEKEDLKRVLRLYKAWTLAMFPQGEYLDTIKEVGQICRKKEMRSTVDQWLKDFSEPPAKKQKRTAEATCDDQTNNASAPLNLTTGDGDQVIKSFDPLTTRDISGLEPVESSNSRSPLRGPLFQPAEGSENEFPIDDDMESILKNIVT